MGNCLYRPSPRRIFYSEEGNSSYFKYGANQVTGWRHTQEDRYVCILDFYENFSFFGVYDGHGGEEVVQYLQRYLHQHIYRELELSNDIELALCLAFLNCDISLQNITDTEYAIIQKDLEKEFEIPDKEERRRILFGLGNRMSSNSAGNSEGRSDDLRAAIASACISQLPSVSYLTKAPEEVSDKSDEDYEPGDGDCNFFDQSDDSLDQNEEPGEEDVLRENFKMDTNEPDEELNFFHTSSDGLDQDEESKDKDVVSKNNKFAMDNKVDEKEIAKVSSGSVEDDEMNKEEKNPKEDSGVMGKQIGVHCGSTATVLLINQKNIYIAHVGDSRCVACINGEAVDLCLDHRPSDTEESERIKDAEGKVSEDGRIEGDIDMSRAFGDFRYKSEDNEPITILSVTPSISVLEITPEMEFIIIASDGIWNTMGSCDIIQYIKNRMLYEDIELQDICGELFEEIIPQVATSDGIGCDNMTAIIIKFMNTDQKLKSHSTICDQKVYEHAKQYNNVFLQNPNQVLPTPHCSSQLDSSEQIEKISNEISDDEIIILAEKGLKKCIRPIQVVEDISSSSSDRIEVIDCKTIPTYDGHKYNYSGRGNMEPPLPAIPYVLQNQQSEAIYDQENCPQPGPSHIAAQGNEVSTNNVNEPMAYSKGMLKLLQSVNSSLSYNEYQRSCLTAMQIRLEKEVARFNNKFLNQFPYPQNSNDENVEPAISSPVDLANGRSSQNVQAGKRHADQDKNFSKKKEKQ